MKHNRITPIRGKRNQIRLWLLKYFGTEKVAKTGEFHIRIIDQSVNNAIMLLPA